MLKFFLSSPRLPHICTMFTKRTKNLSDLCVQQFGNNNSVRHQENERDGAKEHQRMSQVQVKEELFIDAAREKKKSFSVMSYFEISKHLEILGESFLLVSTPSLYFSVVWIFFIAERISSSQQNEIVAAVFVSDFCLEETHVIQLLWCFSLSLSTRYDFFCSYFHSSIFCNNSLSLKREWMTNPDNNKFWIQWQFHHKLDEILKVLISNLFFLIHLEIKNNKNIKPNFSNRIDQSSEPL